MTLDKPRYARRSDVLVLASSRTIESARSSSRARRGFLARRSMTCAGAFEKGGHFAAWEQPQIFAPELSAAFKPLR